MMPVQYDPEGIEIELLHTLAELANAQVLEIGCGDGRLMWHYADEAKGIIGVDPNLEKLSRGIQTYPLSLRSSLAFVQAKAEKLPLVSQRFDLAILGWSL